MAFSDCKLALFDFDETLSAADSLLWLFSSLMPSLKGEIHQNLPPKMPWLEWQNHYFQELQSRGHEACDVLGLVENLPMQSGVGELMCLLRAQGWTVVIVSDSNSLVIGRAMHAHPVLKSAVSAVYTNVASIRKGRIEVTQCPGFQFAEGKHFDKAVVVQDLIKTMKPVRKIFVGDGNNDLAGVQQLTKGDVAFARSGKPLEKRIAEHRGELTCEAVVWESLEQVRAHVAAMYPVPPTEELSKDRSTTRVYKTPYTWKQLGWSLSILGALAAAAPFNAGLTAMSLLASRVIRRQKPATKGTVFITGGKMTKSLFTCRAFKEAGYKVILAETADYYFSAHQWSTAVDKFVLLPEHGNTTEGLQRYADALAEHLRKEKCDLFVPVAHTMDVEGDALIPDIMKDTNCKLWTSNASVVKMLNDKSAFLLCAGDAGLPVPRFYKVSTQQQALDVLRNLKEDRISFFLKGLEVDPINRSKIRCAPLDEADLVPYVLDHDIRPDSEFLIMEFVKGKEYCTTSVVHDGNVLVHTTSPSSAVQLNYEHFDSEAVLNWVQAFSETFGTTGTLSYDFLMRDGVPYAIECNPRMHSAVVNFHGKDTKSALVEAYVNPEKFVSAKPVQPAPSTKETFWTYHELSRIIKLQVNTPRKAWSWLKRVVTGRDALW
eukprot:CAMPEP_0174285474 /NCGR_PEP_ID=MMETSP0809-20121228/8886_1 /TAXON_ID=73025 ORGANISM="Eutreptiella gymnastica-like, Strain CCMP1594" /NCGR_SAMPLE_ID=MMETSP0809 /ASSEMBLY_ACC=CAM_ASM_000658 /LENGTH=658 /DNA_ID=CAMNT_0015381269 /DNA_START=26 /DNA_END=1999 /DNA_ORIENTATION=+